MIRIARRHCRDNRSAGGILVHRRIGIRVDLHVVQVEVISCCGSELSAKRMVVVVPVAVNVRMYRCIDGLVQLPDDVVSVMVWSSSTDAPLRA